jgi:hypothetical protein
VVVADLFINLGLKGSDKTLEGLTGVEKGLKDVSGLALETKVALVGAFYALQQLFQSSGKTGTGLTNFSALLGEGTKTLQQYQYALRQVGVSNEETESTFKNLSSTATKAAYGLGGRPAGLAQVAKYTGGNITQKDLLDYAAHPEHFLQRIKEALSKAPESQRGLLTEAVRSLGIGDTLIAGLRRGGADQQTLNKAPVYSDRQIAALDKANIAWSNLGVHIEMAIGSLNAAHGGELVKDFTQLTDSIITVSQALLKISESAHVFDALNIGAKGLASAVNTLGFGLGAAAKEAKSIEKVFNFSLASKDVKQFLALIKELERTINSLFKGFKVPDVFTSAIEALSPLIGGTPVNSENKSLTVEQIASKSKEENKGKFDQTSGLSNLNSALNSLIGLLGGSPETNQANNVHNANQSKVENIHNFIQPKASLLPLASDHKPQAPSNITNNVSHSPTVNQNIHINGTQHPAKIGEEVKKHTTSALTKSHRDALRQFNTVVQVS